MTACGGGSDDQGLDNAIPPVVVITSPDNGSNFTDPDTIDIGAAASDSDGLVTEVEFFVDGVAIGVDRAAPYMAKWLQPATGAHEIVARARDNDGNESMSPPADIEIQEDTEPPAVRMTRPPDGTAFTKPVDIMVEAEASDVAGQVASVAFFANDELIGSDTIAPFAIIWSDPEEGAYTLTAVATDTSGGESESPAISISVGQSGAFQLNDVRMGDPDVCFGGPEFSDDGEYVVWQETTNARNSDGRQIVKVWHCMVDRNTGEFIPWDCKGFHAFDSTLHGRAYVGRDENGVIYAGANENYEFVVARPTGASSGEVSVYPSLQDPERRAIYPSVLPDSPKIYLYWIKSHGEDVTPANAEWVELRYVDLDDPAAEVIVERQQKPEDDFAPMDVTFPRWAFRQPLIIYGSVDAAGDTQIFELDVSQAQPVPVKLTDDPSRKLGPFPVLYQGRRYIAAGIDSTSQSYLYGQPQEGGLYEILEIFAPPPEETFADACFATSHEPFVYQDKLFTTYQVMECDDFTNVFFTNTGEIWFTQLLDDSDKLWHISRTNTDVKIEPEPLVGPGDAWIFYSTYPKGFDQTDACFQLRRASTPVNNQ